VRVKDLGSILSKNPAIELGVNTIFDIDGYSEALDYGGIGYSGRSGLLNLKGFSVLEKLERNSVIYSALNNFKLSVIEPKVLVKPGSKSDKALLMKSFLEANLSNLVGSINKFCYGLLDAVLVGYSVAEKVYYYDSWGDGVKIFLKSLKLKRPGLYSLKLDRFDNIEAIVRLTDGVELPKEKFIVFNFLENRGNPYGFALFDVLYPLYFAMNELQKLMLLGASKFTNPSVVLYVPEAVSDDGINKVKAFADNIVKSNIGILPERIKAELLDITNKSRNPYIDLLNFFAREIEKVLLLNDLTVSQGDRYGTRAEASVKVEQGKMPLVRYSRRVLEDCLFEQLVIPLMRYNFDSDVYGIEDYPRLVFSDNDSAERSNLLSIVEVLTKLGYLDVDSDKDWIKESLISVPKESVND
jgi:phage gp29-like protein